MIYNKPKITIPEMPKINLKVESKIDVNPIQKEKEELEEMKKIRSATGFSISKLIELKKKGYEIVKVQ